MELVVYLNKNKLVTYNNDFVYIELDNLDNINNMLADKHLIKKQLYTEKDYDPCDKKTIDKLNKYLNKSLTLKDFKKITIETRDINYLLANKSFLESYDKDIFINLKTNSFKIEDIETLKKFDFKKDPLISHEYNNDHYYPLKDFSDSLQMVLKIKSLAEKFDLSEIEKLMFIFDVIKDRVYIKEEGNNSRDLNKVIKDESGSIVCSGFANIFSSVANFLGIKTEKRYYRKDNENVGHVTNICYINDKTYNYRGILEFDTTWDCKHNKNDKNEDSYHFFGKSLNNSVRVKKKIDNLEVDTVLGLTSIDNVDKAYDLYNRLKVNFFAQPLLDRILTIYKYLGDSKKIEEIIKLKKLIEEKNEIKEEDIEKLVFEINNFKNQGLNGEIFLHSFLKVRRIEHYLNPKKYNYGKDTIVKIYNSKFSKSKDTKLLESILGEDYINELILKETLTDPYFKDMNLSQEDKLKLDKERLELANVISRIPNNKNSHR